MGFLADRRRRRIISTHAIADADWTAAVPPRRVFDGLSPDELTRLREFATLFIHEKVWEAPGIGVLEDLLRVEIAALAALPVLELGLSWYENWRTVVVVPRAFTGERVSADENGVVEERLESDVGESWERGPVVISASEVAGSGRGDGYNVVVHEAAHRIDMTDGEINGRPALHRGMASGRWFDVCGAAYADLCERLEAGRRTRIDPYAAEDDAEFFAVMTEFFFERPGVVRAEYPELYGLFVEFYRQDPAARGASVRRRPRRR